MIALLEAYRAGLLSKDSIAHNIVAGVVVGVVAMPLAMAFAIASGATPAQGLYTAIVAGLATWLLGGTRVQISGPTGAFIAVLAEIIERFQHRKIRVLLCGFRASLFETPQGQAVLALVGAENLCTTLAEAARKIARPT